MDTDPATVSPRPSVLVVEDDALLSTIVRRNLEVRGFRVRRAETAAQALELITAEAPALMLLDINLPDGSGWDVLRALGARGQHVPTIVLSAVQVSRARLGEFQPEACLPKPFPLETLLAAIERLTRPAGVPTIGGSEGVA